MTHPLDLAPQSPVELMDYLDHIRARLDPADPDSLLATAPALLALGANSALLVERLNAALADLASWQSTNRWAAPVLLMGSGPGWTVRANVWTPEDSTDSALHSYELPHDHNFSFLTVGHLGPGYRTRVWSYRHRPGLAPGDRVDLVPTQDTMLRTGEVMYYRANQDVHVQHPPEKLSVSVNLLVHPTGLPPRDQYLFDTEAQTVRAIAPDQRRTGQHLLCNVAGFIGDGNTADVLAHIAATHPAEQLRATARRAFTLLQP
jgi:hypothetical protein